jgi:hypothetical protein
LLACKIEGNDLVFWVFWAYAAEERKYHCYPLVSSPQSRASWF